MMERFLLLLKERFFLPVVLVVEPALDGSEMKVVRLARAGIHPPGVLVRVQNVAGPVYHSWKPRRVGEISENSSF